MPSAIALIALDTVWLIKWVWRTYTPSKRGFHRTTQTTAARSSSSSSYNNTPSKIGAWGRGVKFCPFISPSHMSMWVTHIGYWQEFIIHSHSCQLEELRRREEKKKKAPTVLIVDKAVCQLAHPQIQPLQKKVRDSPGHKYPYQAEKSTEKEHVMSTCGLATCGLVSLCHFWGQTADIMPLHCPGSPSGFLGLPS